MSSSSITTTKNKIFFKTNVASRVFPCLLNNSQSTALPSSVANKSSTTADNSAATTSTTTTTVSSKQSSSPANHRVVRSKSGRNKKLQSSSCASVDYLNDLLDKHVLDSQRPDVDLPNDEGDESDEYQEIHVPLPSSVSSPSVKRAVKGVSSEMSISTKRSKHNIKENIIVDSDDDDNHDGRRSPLFQKNVMAKLKQSEVDGQYNRRMFEQLLAHHQRHEVTQKLILENQKKIKKVLLKNKIYVDIEDGINPVESSRPSDDENSFPSELPYSTDGGKTTSNALLIPADRTKKNLFALKLVDKLFSEDELIELDPLVKKDELVEHPSYLFIKEAVRCRFRLTKVQLDIEWPNIHEAILNKRRNWKKNKISPTAGDVINE